MRDGKGLLGLHLVRSRYEAAAVAAAVEATLSVWENHQTNLPMRQDDFLTLVVEEAGLDVESARNAIKSAVTAKHIRLDVQSSDVLPASWRCSGSSTVHAVDA